MSTPPKEPPVAPAADQPQHSGVATDTPQKEQSVTAFGLFGTQNYVEACAKLKISPTKRLKEGDALELQGLVELMHKDGFGQDDMQDDDNKKILLFLYGRGYFKENANRRQLDIKEYLDSKSPSRENLLRVIRTAQDSDNLDASEDTEAYCDDWIRLLQLNGYMKTDKHEKSMTVFDVDVHPLIPVFRRQLTSNCFLHAPAVAHCYLLQIGMKQFHGMMDLAQFVRHNFSGDELYIYTLNRGGNAVGIFTRILALPKLKTLCPPVVELDLITNSCDEPETWRNLVEFGPAVVTQFAIEENFEKCRFPKERKKGVLQRFIGRVDATKIIGTHAMVLIGMTRRVDGTWILLLQNWWKEMQFVEVTAEYLVSSGAELIWVEMPQTKMKTIFP